MLVLEDFVHMVVDALPHVAVIVWVKLEDCLVTVKACAVPRVPLPTVRVDLRGMVSRVKVLEPLLLIPDA